MSIPLPSAQCKDVGTAAAMRAAISGIATCLPDATEVQTLANSVTTCSSFYTIFLTWIAVVWKAICYVFASIGTSGDALQEEIDALEEDVADLQEITSQLPPVPHVGTPSVAINEAVAGTGATATLMTGSTDTEGFIVVVLGSAPTAGGGLMVQMTFGTTFTTQIFPVMTASSATTAGNVVTATPAAFPPHTGLQIAVWRTSGSYAQNNQIRIYYQIAFAP